MLLFNQSCDSHIGPEIFTTDILLYTLALQYEILSFINISYGYRHSFPARWASQQNLSRKENK